MSLPEQEEKFTIGITTDYMPTAERHLCLISKATLVVGVPKLSGGGVEVLNPLEAKP